LPAIIGRAGDVEIPVPDRWVSRRHCCIERTDDVVVIRDLGSSHGTFVNGERVDQAVLQTGDRLGVGLTSFTARVDEQRVTLESSPAW
jgi:pSer/pThr/pTyr-binding forkhead associated (FHA) protein